MADSSDHWEGDLEGTLSDGCGERFKTVGGNARNSFPVIWQEQISQPTDVSFDDRLQRFCGRMFSELKQKFYSGRKEDPEVKLMKLFSVRAVERLHQVAIGGMNSFIKSIHMKY